MKSMVVFAQILMWALRMFAVTAALLIMGVLVTLLGCATFKYVVQSIDDVATVACQLFGRDHPDEFAFMVRELAPAQAKRGFSIRDACAIEEVLHPFIDSQLELQRETAASVRQSMRSPNAVSP